MQVFSGPFRGRSLCPRKGLFGLFGQRAERREFFPEHGAQEKRGPEKVTGSFPAGIECARVPQTAGENFGSRYEQLILPEQFGKSGPERGSLPEGR